MNAENAHLGDSRPKPLTNQLLHPAILHRPPDPLSHILHLDSSDSQNPTSPIFHRTKRPDHLRRSLHLKLPSPIGQLIEVLQQPCEMWTQYQDVGVYVIRSHSRSDWGRGVIEKKAIAHDESAGEVDLVERVVGFHRPDFLFCLSSFLHIVWISGGSLSAAGVDPVEHED